MERIAKLRASLLYINKYTTPRETATPLTRVEHLIVTRPNCRLVPFPGSSVFLQFSPVHHLLFWSCSPLVTDPYMLYWEKRRGD